MAQPSESFAQTIYRKPDDFIGEEMRANAYQRSLQPKPEKQPDVKQYEDDFNVYDPYQDLYLGAARGILQKGEEEAASYGQNRQSIALDRNRRWQDLKKLGKQTTDLSTNASDLYDKMNNPKYSEQEREQMRADYERITSPAFKELKWDDSLKTHTIVSEDPDVNGKPWYEVMRPVEYPDPVEEVDWLQTAFANTQPDKFGARTPRTQDGVEIGGTQDYFSEAKAIKAFNALMKSGTPASQDIIKGGIKGYLSEELGVNPSAITPQMVDSYVEDEEALQWLQDVYVDNASARYKSSVTPSREPSGGGSGSGYISKINARPVDERENQDLQREGFRGITVPSDKYKLPISADNFEYEEDGKMVGLDPNEEVKTYVDRIWIDDEGGIQVDARAVRSKGSDLISKNIFIDENEKQQLASELGLPKDVSLFDYVNEVYGSKRGKGSSKTNQKKESTTYSINGESYSKEELMNAGWTEEQLNQL